MKPTDNNPHEGGGSVPDGDELARTGWEAFDEPLVAIAEAVSAFVNERPSDLPPLGRTLDGDALKRLLTAEYNEANPTVTFEYQGLEVTVTPSEIIVAEGPEGA